MSFGTTPNHGTIGIGARLTLWGAALTTLLVAGVSVALYAGMYYSMQAQIDTFLEGEINEFMLEVNEHAGDDRASEESLREELGARSGADLAFRLLDMHGATILTSADPDPLEGLWTPPIRWRERAPLVLCETIRSPHDTHPHRVCSLRVTTTEGRDCTAQSSYLLDQMNESLARFQRIGVAILVVVPVLALGVGGFLSRRSLDPVRQIMRQTQSMNARDLHSRLPLSGTGDEIDQLTLTLNGLLDRIERRVQEIQRFTADASHELRTPLAALRGSAEVMLSRQRSAEELRQVIEESVSQYERLQRIAEDLLLLARLDAGDFAIKRDLVSLNAAIDDMVDLYLPTAEEKGIELTAQARGQLLIEGDGERLRQVIGNLIDNAIKFTPKEGHVLIRADQVKGYARLQVRDDGVGIPAVDLPRVFDRFYRSDPSRSAQHAPGTGLGLSICRSIVEVHDGQIDVESAMGLGTTVSVHIPLSIGSISQDSEQKS